MPSGADDEAAAARGFAFTAGVLVVLFTAAVIAQVLRGGWGESASRTNSSTLLWPVTWQFYKNPAHQEFIVVYRFGENAGTFDPLTRPVADVEHRWGLGRSAYGDLARLTSTAGAIPPSAWRACAATEVNACSEVIASAPRIAIASRLTSVSCPVVFAVERPTGWHDGWSRQVVRVAVVDLVHSE